MCIRARGRQLFLKTEGKGKSFFDLNLCSPNPEVIVSPQEKRRIIEMRDRLRNIIDNNL